jgi:hypothetical protein
MQRIFILLTVAIFLSSISYAQTAADSVKAVINSMFEGMKNADPALVKEAFSDSVIFQTIGANKEGKFLIRNEKLTDFLDFIGKQQKGAADERIQFETVKIDGPLAIAWTPYKFYLNGKFSHCGVDSFQLVRIDGKWKIQYLIDTRHKEGCNE